MKREIKFRGWDKKDGKMRAINSIAFHYEGESFDYDSSRLAKVVNMWGKDIINDKSVIVHRDIEHVELMQYTGLKDMHGKEIYEGDIVTWSDGEYKHYSNPRIAVVEFNPELSFYAVNVVEHSGLCKYTGRLNHGHKFGYSNFAYSNTEKHLEVAGNIYENRNLLDY